MADTKTKKPLKWLWLIPIQLLLDYLYVYPGTIVLYKIQTKYASDNRERYAGLDLRIVFLEIPAFTAVAVLFAIAAAMAGCAVIKNKYKNKERNEENISYGSLEQEQKQELQTEQKRNLDGTERGILIFSVLEILVYLAVNLLYIFEII